MNQRNHVVFGLIGFIVCFLALSGCINPPDNDNDGLDDYPEFSLHLEIVETSGKVEAVVVVTPSTDNWEDLVPVGLFGTSYRKGKVSPSHFSVPMTWDPDNSSKFTADITRHIEPLDKPYYLVCGASIWNGSAWFVSNILEVDSEPPLGGFANISLSVEDNHCVVRIRDESLIVRTYSLVYNTLGFKAHLFTGEHGGSKIGGETTELRRENDMLTADFLHETVNTSIMYTCYAWSDGYGLVQVSRAKWIHLPGSPTLLDPDGARIGGQ